MATNYDEVKVGFSQSKKRLKKMSPFSAEAEVVKHQPEKCQKPKKHLQKMPRLKAKRKTSEILVSENKKKKISLATSFDSLQMAQDELTNSELNIDETNSQFNNQKQLPNASEIEDLSHALAVFINGFENESAEFEPQLEPQIEKNLPANNFVPTTNKGRSSESELEMLPRSSELTVEQSTNSDIVLTNNLYDFCQDKENISENIQGHLPHAACWTQNNTSMSMLAQIPQSKDGAFKALIAKYLNISMNAESILQEMCCSNGTSAIYKYTRFDKAIYQCEVSLAGKSDFEVGTGRTRKDSKKSATLAMIDQLTMGKLFGNLVGLLQELCRHFGWPLPHYIEHFKFRNHQFFKYSCILTHITAYRKLLKYLHVEQGRSKKIAKRLATLKMLININDSF